MNEMNVAEVASSESESLTAIYKLPVHIWMSCAAMGGRCPSGFGRVQFDVVMPENRGPFGGPPEVENVEVPVLIDEKPVVWTTEYAADIAEKFQPATALLRVVITAVKAPVDPARSWSGPDAQLGACIASWFDQVRSWVEICAAQDLDPDHPLYDAQTVGEGLTFIAGEGDLVSQFVTRRIQPVTAAEWEWILRAVLEGKEPPLESLLLRDANAAYARGFYRRAVIDAAAALELSLVRRLEERIDSLPERQRKRLKGATLGKSIGIAELSRLEFDVTFEDLKRLNDARNDAIHRAQAPDDFETWKLLHGAGRFLRSSVRLNEALAGPE